ncbi:hypothetical protein HAX54_028879 [Datura stramonium]|uniref:Uncharacterized protein n=1 Tax=Datura stramonium TaxID=4076 RepID=A0ABS8V766_DATST|nr:hypothetical protein [Datura stramonium]
MEQYGLHKQIEIRVFLAAFQMSILMNSWEHPPHFHRLLSWQICYVMQPAFTSGAKVRESSAFSCHLVKTSKGSKWTVGEKRATPVK